ncbi:Rho guanine nucleotide exchange factor 5, partial [Opisthocomus hoazin]
FRRRHSKLINSSRLLYQEYSDVVLNKAIQSQKRVDSFAEDIESSFPSSPRLRRKVLSPQDSYLQRLSVSSNASLWQDIPMIRGSRILLNMSRDEQKLQEAKFELIMSEASYLRSLNVAVDHFQRSVELQAMLTNQERQWLFSRLNDVRDVSASFLFDLEEKFEEDMFTFHVCDVALKHAPEFRRVYLPYVTNQTYQEQTFQRLLNGNAGFQQVLERLESDPVCQRLSLKSFLILPFQRITRLKLLLQNILKRTRPGSEEEVQATQAYDALEKLIKDCNENVQRMKSTEELIYLSQKIEFECKIFPLISQSRRLVKCGELTALDFNTLSPKWKVTTRPIYLHLFNDCLLLSRPKEGGRFVVFDHAPSSDVRGEKCEMKLHGTNKNVFDTVRAQGYPQHILLLSLTLNPDTCLVMFSSSEKLRWISALAPPRGELDLLECPDAPQVQCIKTYKARENDELALEKADIIMVMQYSNDGWIEGVKLSDRERGWFPSEHVELISSKHARQKNLKEEQRVKNAKQQVFCKK